RTGKDHGCAGSFSRTETTETGTEIEQDIPLLKTYTVFNTDQITGLNGRFEEIASGEDPMSRIGDAGRFFANNGALIRHGGSAAYYAAQRDYIQ
ncbi:antirestriction protein ArdC, partial [Rhizobium ruizarguesonis]